MLFDIVMKIKFLSFLFICAFLLMACATREERQIKSLQQFTVELKTNSDCYTDEQWQHAINEYEQITESLKGGRYTDDERREIGKLKGQCLAIFAQYAIGTYEREIKGATSELEGALEGFFKSFDADSEQ